MSKHVIGIVATLLAAAASAQTTVRVNLGPGGVQANQDSYTSGTTNDGSIVYASFASNLVANDTNGQKDVFVSTPQGVTTRVSVSTAGTQANGPSGALDANSMPAISANGLYVAFDSLATNLVGSDTNGVADIFLRNLQSGVTTRVSIPSGSSGQANGASLIDARAISSDGRYLVFASDASNLVTGDTNGFRDIFVRDLSSSVTTRISVGPGGVQANNWSNRASITPDGRYVVYHSDATNLIANDANSASDVFLYDRQTGTTELVSLASNGMHVFAAHSYAPAISANGRFVAFTCLGALVPLDTNADTDVYLRDRALGTTELISIGEGGAVGGGTGFTGASNPSISDSGNLVAFVSGYSNLVTPDTNGAYDTFVRDRIYGTTWRISSSTSGVQGSDSSYRSYLSPNGLYSCFTSTATNLVPNDTNAVADVFLRTLSLPSPPNDDCATPEPILGTGVFPFDATRATTGSTPISLVGCCEYLTKNDVWFVWTSTFSGDAEISTCGQATTLTQIAVYAGNQCPIVPAMDCSDAVCGNQSFVRFPASAGASYMIQVGSYEQSPSQPAEFGSGTLTIAEMPNGACTPVDDGHTEQCAGGADENFGWLQRFGTNGEVSTITAVMTAWGSAQFHFSSPPNGIPAQVGIWDDPNDDGNPDDLVLLQLVDTVITGSGTDALQYVALQTPVTVNGQYFVGAGTAATSGTFPIPLDQSTPLAYRGRSYFVEGPQGPINLGAMVASGPVGQLCGPYYEATFLLRPVCGTSIVFCVPGQAGVIACPCSNPGQPGRGCENSSGTGGALLNLSGNATLAADTLVFTTSGEKPSALSVVLQGGTRLLAGAVYGQGVRCTAGTLKRLYTKSAVAGSITAPVAGDPSVSSRSASLNDPLSPGTTRYYQVYYRDPVVQGGCPANATFNLTQGHIVTWI